MTEPLHVPRGTAPAVPFYEHVFHSLASGEQTGGSYSTLEFVSPQGSGSPPHTHDESEESFFVIEGEVDFVLGGVSHIAHAGDFVHVPRRRVHSFTVLSLTARVLASYAPAGEERLFFSQPEV